MKRGIRGLRERAGKRALPLRWSLLALACLTGCGGSSTGSGRTSFNAFVRQQIEDNTADDTEPLSLQGLQFRFDEDPDAFDDLF